MRCVWVFVPDDRDSLEPARPLAFRCQVCRRRIQIGHGESADALDRAADCTGRPEDSPPAFRFRSRVRGYVLAMKRRMGLLQDEQ